MNTFSISELEQYSGIKAHTIRIWEQRYNALSPMRSEGNTRHYDNSQLRRLLNIVSLINANYKVSEICTLSDKQIFKLLDEQLANLKESDETSNYYISQLISAGMSYDEIYFEKLFSSCLLRYGFQNTYIKILQPMLIKVGLMWANNTIVPAQEHFISNILKQKIYVSIDALPPVISSKNTWLLFLPENEYHEIGLLLSHYLIKHAGIQCIYLGSNVPLETLSDAVKTINPTHLLFFLQHNNKLSEVQSYIKSVKKIAPKSSMHFSGNSQLIAGLEKDYKENIIKSIEALMNKLTKK